MTVLKKRADQLENGDLILIPSGNLVVRVQGVMQFLGPGEVGHTHLALEDITTHRIGEFKFRNQQAFDVVAVA